MGKAVIFVADDCGRYLSVVAKFFEVLLNGLSLATFGVDRQLNVMLRLLQEVHPEGKIVEEIRAKISPGYAVIDFKFTFYEQESGKVIGEEVSRLNGSFCQR